MGKQLDWRKARTLDVSEPGYKERRLDKAADNWLDHGTLTKYVPAAAEKIPKPKRKKGRKR
jgi:hypothetical protein